MEEWDVYLDIFVVTKTSQEVDALKEIPGRRDQGIRTLFPKIQFQLLISRTRVSGLLNIRKPGLIFTVIRIMADIVEMDFYYKISFYKCMYKSIFT